MSGRNKYFEGNAIGGKTINQIQGNIRLSYDIQANMKENSYQIFDMMKTEKGKYIKTLIDGEENGHCKGIKQRLDPTIKYRL